MTVKSIVSPIVKTLVRGIGGSGGGEDLTIFLQDSQTRTKIITGNWVITHEDFIEFTVFIVDSSAPILMELPLVPIPSFGERIAIKNIQESDIIVRGSRNTSVNRGFEVTVDSPYIEVINMTADETSLFVNYAVIQSS